jgi:predicted nucleic acid-binding protein
VVIGPGVTLDTGALIALERKAKRMRDLLASALSAGRDVTVPAAVVVEWWRAAGGQARILGGLVVEPMSERLAKAAGEALATVAGATAIDAVVMASAALRGDVVYTSDLPDLERLRSHFPSVRLLRVSGAGE